MVAVNDEGPRKWMVVRCRNQKIPRLRNRRFEKCRESCNKLTAQKMTDSQSHKKYKPFRVQMASSSSRGSFLRIPEDDEKTRLLPEAKFRYKQSLDDVGGCVIIRVR